MAEMNLSRRVRLVGFYVLACALVLAAAQRSARADAAFPYASVVCQGNQALVRFVFAWNQDAPVFVGSAAHLPNATARALDPLPPINPSRCTLADGRRIVLRQGDKGDAQGYGCVGETTELFSLWVGPKPAYRREVWHNKCGFPYDIVAVVIDGAKLTECRAVTKPSVELSTSPPTCADHSERLRVADTSPGRPGKMVLLRAADGMAFFCHTLVKDGPAHVSDIDTPWDTWPTYQRTGLQEIGIWADSSRLQEAATAAPIDLNNSGKLSRALVAESWSGGPNGNQSV